MADVVASANQQAGESSEFGHVDVGGNCVVLALILPFPFSLFFAAGPNDDIPLSRPIRCLFCTIQTVRILYHVEYFVFRLDFQVQIPRQQTKRQSHHRTSAFPSLLLMGIGNVPYAQRQLVAVIPVLSSFSNHN